MVSLVALVRRKSGWDDGEFHDYWRRRHGPLVVEKVGRHLVRYEQHHRQSDGVGSDGADGIAILTFASSDDLRALLEDPAYADVAADEARFLDRDAVVWFVAEPPDVLLERATRP